MLRAFLKGTEVAVKRPRVKITLNPQQLKTFTREVTTMLKASGLYPVVAPSSDISYRSTTRTA